MIVDGGRLKLRGERVRIVRRDDGSVEVEGPVVASSCACEPPPLSVEARRFVVTPAGEVRARDVTLRVMDARTLTLPWLSLRAPTQLGLLPPTLGWRASDGPFAGAGAHVPLGGARSVDLHAGGYLRATGFDTVATLDTERSRLRARWERLRGDRVTLAGRASIPGTESVSASVDAVRGPGVSRAAVDVDTAARARDRLDVALDASTLGASAFVYAPRGEGGGIGSGARIVAPLDLAARAASLSMVADASSLSSGSRSVGLARARAVGAAGGFVGAARLDARASLSTWLSSDESGGGSSGVAGSLVAGVGLPLARRFAGGAVHVLEPGLRVATFVADERGDGASFAPSAVTRGRALALSAPLATSLGPPGRGVASLSLEPGALTRGGAIVAVAQLRAGLRSTFARADVHAALVAREALGVARAQLGPRALFVRLTVESLRGANPIEARALELGDATRARWLASEGTTARAGVAASRGPWFADASRVWSFPAGVALADEARVGLRPRCRCVEVSALGARRLGREGVDVMVQASLFR